MSTPPVYGLGVAVDISTQKHAADAATSAEARFRTLFRASTRSYTRSARAKCGAKTRTEAVVLALARGEISL